MEISILTPDQEYYSGEITAVIVPGVTGTFQVLDQHAPLVSALKAGQVTLEIKGGQRKNFSIQRGFIEVLNNEVNLLVQGLED